MNKNLYRIVFNQKTGAQTAVAETAASRHRHVCSATPLATGPVSPCRTGRVRLTSLALGIAMLSGSISIASARISADPDAPGNRRPVIDNTASGLPLVQIATPNSAGVSHNQYRQFNTDPGGAILNNASAGTSTRLGGWVGGNPRLAGGSARLIVNEVTGTNPSALRGYLEVAGQRADVVVSNPNGILVDGSGFINAGRGVLTTGVPVFSDNGALHSLRVTRGAIDIGSGGFNDQDTAQVDLIARSLKVNGELHASRLRAVTGANQVDYASLGVQIIRGEGDAPAVAIDIAALGGMFANSIYLIGTEAGVGVRSYGQMATSAEGFTIDSKGSITLTGDTTSAGNLALSASNGIDNSGTAYAARNTALSTDADIVNSGTVAAFGNTSATARALYSTGTLGAGVDVQGRLTGDGSLTALVSQTLAANGKNLSARDATFSGSRLDLSGANTRAGGALRYTATAGDIDHRNAATSAAGTLEVLAAGLNNSGGILETSNATAGNLNVVSTGIVTNLNGTMRSARHLGVRAATLAGDGAAIAGLDLSIALSGDYTQTAANLFSAVGSLDFSTTGKLINFGNFAGGGATTVSVGGLINQAGGLFNSNGLTALSVTDSLINYGRIYGDDIALHGNSITNDLAAVIAARKTLNAGAATVINREHALMKSDGDMALGGALDAAGQATGSATSIINSSASVDSGGKLAIASASLTNTNARFTSEVRLDPGKSRSWTEFEADGNDRVYSSDEAYVDTNDREQKLIIRGKGTVEDYTRRSIRETTSRTEVIHSDPASMLSRGDMLLTGGPVVNDKSVIIAGGTLDGDIRGQLDNGGTNPQGETIVRREITSTHHTVETCGDFGTKHCSRNGPDVLSRTMTVTHFDLGIWKALHHTAPPGVANPGAGQHVRPVSYIPGSDMPHFSVPGNLLYRPVLLKPGYLIETDPAFVNLRQFLSSDYQLSRLGMDPQTAQKRLGDGYYEQQLVNDQILQLTGRKTLGSYAGNEDQFRALLDAGVMYAQKFQLVPGIALTAEQMAALTSDLVWLVEQRITLADGSSRQVLAPVVYLSRLHAQDVRPAGSVIRAGNIRLRINGSLDNAGTLTADNNLLVDATQDISNKLGTIAGDSLNGDLLLQAGRDINHQSGAITGARVGMLAGRDLNAVTLANTTAGAAGTQISLDRLATINAATLTAQAGRDARFDAAAVATTGDAGVTANGSIHFGAVTTQNELNVAYDDKNHLYRRQEQANGTVFSTGGNAVFIAGHDLSSEAAYVNSARALSAVAGNNASLGVATQRSRYDQEIYTASSGLFSSASSHSKDQQTRSEAVGSTFSGDTVMVQAGKGIGVIGSNVVSTSGTQLAAVGNISILTSRDTFSQTYSKVEKKSGVFSGGGIGVTIGSRTLENDQTVRQVSNNAATVGSTHGDVNIIAGKTYAQTGSNLTAPAGDISVKAQQVSINAAHDTSDSTQDTRFRQSGVTLQITSPVISAIQTAQQMKQASGQTSDARLLALAGATTALAGKNAVDAISKDPAHAGGINFSVSLGSSKSQSHSEQHASVAKGSAVTAGGSAGIAATGDGGNSDLTIAGSSVGAGRNVSLQADHNLNLIAEKNTAVQHSTNSNSSASIGIGFAIGGSQNGFTLNASVSGGRGNADGSDVSYTNTRITAGNQLTTASGNDTSLKGAVAGGRQVSADAGGNLSIESLQDTSTYQSRQQSAGVGVSLCIPPFCTGASSVSANVGQSNINSNYASVTGQSAIKAGDEGFDIRVRGNTGLKGSQIASTGKAVQDGKNSLTTATLTQSAIRNHAAYSAQSVNVGGGYSFGGNSGGNNGNSAVGTDQQGKAQSGPAQVPGTTLPSANGLSFAPPVAMNARGNAASTTRSGISGGKLVITHEEAQQQKTGQSARQAIAAVNRDVASDKDGTDSIAPIFNEKEIQAGFAIAQAFGREVGSYISNRAQEADARLASANDPKNKLTSAQRDELRAEAALIESNWGPGGAYRQVATALSAAASGNVTGGAGQFAQAATVNYLQSLAAGQIKRIAGGMGSESARAALHAVVGCAGAAGQGAGCGPGAMGAGAASVIGSLISPADTLTATEKEARRNALANLIAAVAATGNHAAAATGAGQIEAENNTLYVWRNNVMRTDKIPNDKVVVLGRQDAWRVLKQPLTSVSYPQLISPAQIGQLSDSQVYDLTLTKDFETLRKGTDMGYYTTSDNTQVYFQNGMDNHAPDAKASSALLAGLLNQPVGAIINDSHGIAGDVKEYLPNMLAVKDVLNEYTYRKLDAQGQPVLIVMHSAGNEDARKALEAGNVYGHQYPNLSFLSVGSPVSAGKLQSVMQQTGATFLGQVNNWRDPVTNSKTAGAGILALGGTGLGVGLWVGIKTGAAAGAALGMSTGPLSSIITGVAGAAAGAFTGAAIAAPGSALGFYALKNYHPFTQYFQNPQLQQQVLDWQKQQQPAILKK